MKKIRIKLSDEAEEAYDWLCKQNSKAEKSILKSIHKKTGLIKQDPHYGEPIAKMLIPRRYKTKYGITNLFWIRLSCYWRMLYSLTSEGEIEIIAFVLDIMDHKTYDKLLGYRKK